MTSASPFLNRVMVVGNVAGGKTALSRRLARLHDLPLTHVDTIEFEAGMKLRPRDEARAAIREIENQAKWLIDGFGPFDLIENRFQIADRIVFVDLPLWRHAWWCTKRQIKSLWSPRSELASGSRELTFEHTRKLYKTMWSMHDKMRPELLKIFSGEGLARKTILIQNMKNWNALYKNGLTETGL